MAEPQNGGGKIIALLLAGGQSRRMGFDKLVADFFNAPLFIHTGQILTRQVDGLVVAVGRNLHRLSPLSPWPVIPDATPMGGPLAGLVAGLRWAHTQKNAIHALVVAPADTPFLPFNLVARLQDVAHKKNAAAVYIQAGGRGHYLTAFWSLAALPILEKCLAQGVLRIEDCLKAADAVPAIWEETEAFMNLNYPDDWARAQGWPNDGPRRYS